MPVFFPVVTIVGEGWPHMESIESVPAVPDRGPLTVITRGIVRMHSEYFGKGPTRAKTERVGPDLVICVLHDALTPVERTLITRGRGEQVRSLRRSFQDVMEQEFRDVVELTLNRKVVAFMSQVSLDPDIAAELFFLAPDEPGGRPAEG